MGNSILDYTDFCINGTTLLDGQRISGLESCVSYGVSIHEEVDTKALNEAVRQVYSEIDCFHMHLVKNADGSSSYLFDKDITEELHIVSAEGATPAERLEYAKNRLIAQSSSVRDRYSFSPFFAELYRIDSGEFFLAAYLDRYVSDGHSIGVALMKILSCYKGTVIAGGVSTKSMRDYIAGLSDEKAAADAEYWRSHIGGCELPPYSPDVRDLPAFDGRPRFMYFPRQKLSSAARRLKTTAGSLFTAVYHLTLMTVFGSADNVISYVSTDRNSLDEWGIIGPFVKPLSSRILIDTDDTLGAFVKKVSAEAGDNLRHKSAHIRDIPISRYGMSFLNHSKPFLPEGIYTQYMPDLYLDGVDASFIYLRIQELADVFEVEFVCPRSRFSRRDYEKTIAVFGSYTRAFIGCEADTVLRNMIQGVTI